MNASNPIERIGRYQVLERVGKGGMGVLYRGFDPVLDREVAIKLMLTDFSEDAEQMRPRFYREARAAAKLNHRNIVTIFEFAEESNVPYIVMEFLRGTSLGARLASPAAPLSLDDKLNVVAQLCDGLAYAHDQGVVHRDVKPDNIFILEDGSVKLLDFGIAKLTTSNLTRQGDVLGSASYMSPEQVGGSDSVDGRADIFSTGVVLYELLTGRKPFQADVPTAVILKILKDDPPPIDSLVAGVPPPLAAAVMKALAKEPDDRFATADALGRELQMIRRSIPASALAAELDETRFASTQMMKALHADLQKLREQSDAGGTTAAVAQAAVAARDAALAAAPESPKRAGWIGPAAIAVIVLLAGAGYFLAAGRQAPAAPATAAAPPDTERPAAAAATAAPAAAADAAPPRTPDVVPAAAARPAPAVPQVRVSLAGAYPFAVLEGGRTISPPSTTHDLTVAAGRTLVLSAPEHFLRQTVRVDGSAAQGFDWTAPALGKLDVRSAQETCDVMIGDRKLGNPPLVVPEIAAGQYKVDISCAGEVVKSHYATVRAGQTYVAAIR